MSIVVPNRMFFRIGEVADLLGLKPYVLRFWESQFPGLAPQKSSAGQRVYRRTEVEMLVLIQHLLYSERYSIEGARKKLRDLRKQGKLSKYKSDTLGRLAANDSPSSELNAALMGGQDRQVSEIPSEVGTAIDRLVEAHQVAADVEREAERALASQRQQEEFRAALRKELDQLRCAVELPVGLIFKW